MAVITISREMGSAGEWETDRDFILARLVEKTGYHYADKNFFSKVFREYGFSNFDREYTQPLSFWERFDTHRGEERAAIVDLLNRTTLALARHGNMIMVGRGNFAMLQGLTDVLNIRIQADLSTRTEAVGRRFRVDGSHAEEIVRKNDKLRESFIKDFYNVRGDWADGFDLALNTGKIGVQAAVDMILTSVKRIETHRGPGPDCGSLPIDSDMQDTVNTLLSCTTPHRP